MDSNTPKYNIGKLSISLLEHFIEPAIGKQAVDEIKRPYLESELRESLSIAFSHAETAFIQKYKDRPIASALLALPLDDLPSVRNAIFSFYKQPNTSDLAILLETFLCRDFPKIDPEEIQQSIAEFIYLLRMELANINSEIREKMTTHVLLDISKRLSELPLSIEKPETKTAFGVLPPLPDFKTFVGRDGDLDLLKWRMGVTSSTNPKKLTIIRGWPGVGKTTLATVLAYQQDIRSHFPDGIFWASLGDMPNSMATIKTWGVPLQISEILQSCRTVDEAVNYLRQSFASRKSLLIIDDVYELVDGKLFRDIAGEKCVSIFTTRFKDIATSLAINPNEDIYVLSKLSDENSLELLRLLSPDSVSRFPEESKILVRELEGLPLAIQVAGRMLFTDMGFGINVVTLLQDLKESTSLMDQPTPANRIGLASETNITIAALLNKSTARLSDQDRFRFALLSTFTSKPATFDIDAVRVLWDVGNPIPTIRELVNRGLLEFDPVTSRYQMHSILTMHAKQIFEN